jgi:hypothetical protein
VVRGKHELDAVAAIVHAEPESFDLWRYCWIESQHLSMGAHTGQAAQQKIHRAGHCPEVNAFRRGAALDVGDVTLQGLLQESPGLVGGYRARIQRGYRARIQAVTTKLSVEPCEVRAE